MYVYVCTCTILTKIRRSIVISYRVTAASKQRISSVRRGATPHDVASSLVNTQVVNRPVLNQMNTHIINIKVSHV